MAQTISKSNVWSTKKVEELVESYNRTGVIPMDNPFFMRKMDKKKSDLVWEFTPEEIMNMARCKSNILTFAGECKTMTKDGVKKIRLRPYQIVALKKLQANNFFLYLASRQIGKSILIAIFIAWVTTFFPEQACLLGSENIGKAKDLKSKIDTIIHGLPFYMQNGVVYFSTQRSIYDNGSKVISEPTTENFGVSGSFNLVYIDEFALIEPTLQDKIITHVVPTLDSFGDQARFIITTTPRGKSNKFYYLWIDALEGKNKFGTFITKWFEVDGRDDKWRQEQIALITLEGFNQEYDLSFDADSTLLFGSEEQKLLTKSIVGFDSHNDMAREILVNHVMPDRKNNIKYKVQKNPEFSDLDSDIVFSDLNDHFLYENLIMTKQGFDINNLTDQNRQFVVSTDLAEGVGKDFSISNFFEVVPMNAEEIKNVKNFIDESSFFKLEQVAIIRSNQLDIEDFAKFNYFFISGTNNEDNFRLIIEQNYEGSLYMKTIFEINGDNNELDPSAMVVEFPWNMEFEDAVTFKSGIKQTAQSKKKGSKSVKRAIIQSRIIVSEEKTILEAQGFGKDKKGNYKGTTKNDDSFMTVLNVSHYFESDYFSDQVEELMDSIDEDLAILIETKMESQDDDSNDFTMFSENR